MVVSEMNIGRNGCGLDYSEFDTLIKQLEQLGVDMDEIADRVLDAGSEPARQAFIQNMPYDDKTPESRRQHEHARDNVTVTGTRKSKRGNKYRLVGAHGRKFEYLYYVEYGHSKAPAHPFVEHTYRAANVAAKEAMQKALYNEIDRYLEGG